MHKHYHVKPLTFKVVHPQKSEARFLQLKKPFAGCVEYEIFVKNVRSLFDIDENQKFSLTYRDAEGDEISLRSALDLSAATNQFVVPRISIRFEAIKDEEISIEKDKSGATEVEDLSSALCESFQSIMKQLEQGISTLQASVEKSTTQTVDAVVKTAAETAANVYRSMLPAPTLSDKPQFDIICDGCYTPIRGQRWRCETCDDFDLCSACKSRVNHNPQHNFRFITPPPPSSSSFALPEPSVSLSMNSHHAVVVRDEASQAESSQTIFICDYCDNDIVGIRHSCAVCPDFDLCHSCFSIVKENHPEHIFVTRLVGTQTNKKFKSTNEAIKQNFSTTISSSPRPSHDTRNTPTLQHRGVDCDNCQREIVGPRYKCGHCSNYDLCEICEEYAPELHDKTHAFIKIRYPIQSLTKKPLLPRFSPLTTAVNQEDEIKQSLKEAETINHAASSSSNSSSGKVNGKDISSLEKSVSSSTSIISIPNSPFITKTTTTVDVETAETLSATFVSDLNIPDGTLVVPNKSFIKMWKVVNDGSVDWPMGTHLLFNGGSILRPYPVTKPNTFMVPVTSPNEEACISAELQAPDCPGEYSSYFCLCTADGIRFGDSLWCTIRVDVDEEPDHKSVNTSSATSAADIMMNSSNSMIYPTISTAASSNHEQQQQQQQDSAYEYTDHDDYSEFTNDHHSVLTSEAATTHTETDSHMSSPTSSELDIGERHRQDVFFTEEDSEEDSQQEEQVTHTYQVISPSASTTLPASDDTKAVVTLVNDEEDFVMVDEQVDEFKEADDSSHESNSLHSSVQTITNKAATSADLPSTSTQGTVHDASYYRSQLLQIHEMGFTSCDDLAISLLNLHNGRVEDVIAKLLYYS